MAERLDLKFLEARPKADMHNYRARLPKGLFAAARRKATIDGISLNKAINVMVRGYVMGKINVMKMMEDDQ
jgi:hypothetical protein